MTKDVKLGLATIFVCVFVGIIVGIQYMILKSEEPAPTKLVEVEIISVLNESPFTSKTLIEFEDGTRRVFGTYYGEEGDTFFMEVEVDGR